MRALARRRGVSEILPTNDRVPHSGRKTPIAWQFGWGGTRSKRYRACPKITSSGSEIRSRVQEQIGGLTVSSITRDADAKAGSSEPFSPLDAGEC